MSLVITPGYTWVDGEVETAAKMNSTASPTVADGQIYPFSLGTAALPSVTFTGDLDTGIYEYAANMIGFSTNGAVRATVSTYFTHLNGDNTTGVSSLAQHGYGYNVNFGYQHFVQTRHDAAAGGSGNAWVLWLNNSATAAASTAPGTNNTKAVDFNADNIRLYSNNGTLGLTMTSGQGFIATIEALSGTTPTINFNNAPIKTHTLSGNTTYATSNLVAGTSVTVWITADGSPRTLSWPASWIWVGTAPTSIAASKNAILSLISKSTTDASVIASWSVQA